MLNLRKYRAGDAGRLAIAFPFLLSCPNSEFRIGKTLKKPECRDGREFAREHSFASHAARRREMLS